MKKYCCLLLAICLLLSVCGCSAKTQTESSKEQSASHISETSKMPVANPTNTEISYGFIDYKMFDSYLTKGTYRCGSDFDEGYYYILSLYSAEAYYDVSDNPNDFTWSDYRVIRKISASTGQYVKLSSAALLVSADEIDESNWKMYGVFLVGTDLPEGDYKITSLEDSYHSELENITGICGAYQISNNTPVDEPENCCPLFDKQTYISVKNGQYVVINNARMTLVGSETANSNQQTNEVASNAGTDNDSQTNTNSNITIGTTEKAYNTACSLTISNLDKKMSYGGITRYYYKGLIIQSEDEEWLLTSLNKEKSLNQGALYRTIASYLEGFKIGLNNGSSYCEIMCGFKWRTKKAFEPYVSNASEFIVKKDQLKSIMQKLKNINSVQGEFDFDYKELGKYNIDISDLTDCADEMQISEEMLGYIFAMLDEYAVDITFDGNSCHIKYTSYK